MSCAQQLLFAFKLFLKSVWRKIELVKQYLLSRHVVATHLDQASTPEDNSLPGLAPSLSRSGGGKF